MFTTATEQDCVDVCVRDSSCVGVDVRYNVQPKLCWIHNDRNDYHDSNVYRQPGTNTHELIMRCPPTGCFSCVTSVTKHHLVNQLLAVFSRSSRR